jgi:hypothetical protein
MNATATPNATRPCRNEECFRAAEAGESYCAACGLERSLFDRDARRRRADAPGGRAREESRG